MAGSAHSLRGPRLSHLWLLYAAMLFALPNAWRPAGLAMAPESLLLLSLVLLRVAGDVAYDGLGAAASGLRGLPAAVWALAGAMALGRAAAGGSGLPHLALWTLTLGSAALFARGEAERRSLVAVWRAVAAAAAAWLLLSPSRWGRLDVDVLAWQHRTTLGYFLACPAILALDRLAGGDPRARHPARLVECALLLAALFVTRSRGPWIAACAGAGLALALRGRRKTALALVGASVLGGALLAARRDGETSERLRSIVDLSVPSSSQYRLDLYAGAWRAMTHVGLFGRGPGTAGDVLHRHGPGGYGALRDRDFATDSDLVWLCIEAGPVAAAAALWLLAAWGRRLVRGRARWRADPEAGRAAAALFVVFAFLFLFDNVLSSALGWFLLGTGLRSAEAAP
jgi:hypothetical protein